ncbi:Glyoxalase/Bleomycin resistance protein/Dihydroxybiphenyl dioxygenase [Obelidium mucronatum]|nr:Glyoxalase/Bleomycin resistance protein/Dihydroxybiphenyl dioxygenase [Obelidium mucronatum]
MAHNGLLHGNQVISADVTPVVSSKTPLTSVVQYSALGVAVSNVPQSIAFYNKLGWQLKETTGLVSILSHPNGLELHVFESDRAHVDNKNILMDFDDKKYPGINHMSFAVPNVASAKEFLESNGLSLSGIRQYPKDPRIYAIFIRDPDQTTLEFEKHGEEEIVDSFHSGLIGNAQRPIDHVGIRVSDPNEVLVWYAEKLGFNNLVAKFEYNPEKPLSNVRPWIIRTKAGVEINLILNTNETPKEHVLTTGGLVAPGILFTVWQVDDTIANISSKLKAEGVVVVGESDVATSHLKFLANRFVVSPAGRTSIFIQDPCLNIIRLQGSE